MNYHKTLEEFAIDFQQQIIAEANINEEEKFHEQVFVDQFLEHLYEAAEIGNGTRCQHKSLGIKVDGYNYDDDSLVLDLFVALYYDNPVPPIPIVYKNEIDIAFKRVFTFLERSLNESKLLSRMEDSAEVIDLTKLISKFRNDIRKVRLILLSNGLVNRYETGTDYINEKIEVSYQIWDLQRLFRFLTSGIIDEPILVDFESLLGKSLDCVLYKEPNGLYDTYLAIIPGNLLAKLYEEWGTRLLERNVRAYLQAQNKKSVNYIMKETIKTDQNLFLAYNNGITVTAKDVQIKNETGIRLSSASDFQIVNGGQTTATLWHINYKEGYNIEGVYVQMKLTVINDASQIDKIIPKIGLYSNSQNKVNTADFAANDPFHRNLEQISRSVWSPDPSGGNKQTKWFYERSRGSFYETRNREKTESEKKKWDAIHLRTQKFDKTYLAKIEKTWMLQPYEVSLGAQKNFSRYAIYLKEQNINNTDETFFKRLISKIIIWKAAEKIIDRQNIPGYRANIITYTLAFVVHKTAQRINLEQIWKDQKIGDGLAESIDIISGYVREHITNTSDNVTEYCKKERCWQKLIESDIKIPPVLIPELIDISYKPHSDSIKQADSLLSSSNDEEIIDWISSIPAETWKKVSRWGSLTKSLVGYENSMCFNIGRSLSKNRRPSLKLARQGKIIYEKAVQMGFDTVL